MENHQIVLFLLLYLWRLPNSLLAWMQWLYMEDSSRL